MSRYTATNFRDTTEYRADGVAVAVLSIGDLTDTRTGDTYPCGAQKVTLTKAGRDLGFRSKTFKGETAWMDADRLIHDVLAAAHYRAS